MTRLLISLATRGRPQQVVQTINHSVMNLVEEDTIIQVQVDDDDLRTAEAIKRDVPDSRVQVNIAPREDTIAEKWNRALKTEAELYQVAADDDPYITPGYDRLINEAAKGFPDGLGFVYGNLANASFPCGAATTRGMCQRLGYIFPVMFPYWFVDHWVDDVARITGRIAVADYRTDQSRAGKTQEMREPAWWATFFDAGYLARRREAHDIIKSADFDEPDWRKEILLNHHPLIEYRSRWINENVRANSRALEQMSALSNKDDRYLRVKKAAVERLPHFLDDYGMNPNEANAYRKALTPPTVIRSLERAYA